MIEIISRIEADRQGLKRYFTGRPCKNGHISERWTKHKSCIDCVLERNKLWRAENPEKSRASCLAWRIKNPDAVKAKSRREYVGNEDKVKAKGYAWRKKNLGRYNAHQMKRIADKIKRTPMWANMDEIAKVYQESVRVSAETGVKHHVDHYFPLNGKLVSGLHVETNLRVIPAIENIVKSNRLLELQQEI